MKNDELVIFGDLHIVFDEVRVHLHREPECRQRVFGSVGGRSAMRDDDLGGRRVRRLLLRRRRIRKDE